jgi:hypothetical protein
MKCGSHAHNTEHCPNVTIREIAQQHQIEESSYDSFSSSSAEELHAHMGQYSDSISSDCLCSDSEECACHVQYNSDSEYFSESSEEEGKSLSPRKKKSLWPQQKKKN